MLKKGRAPTYIFGSAINISVFIRFWFRNLHFSLSWYLKKKNPDARKQVKSRHLIVWFHILCLIKNLAFGSSWVVS